jgi:hypothetical protein
MTEKDFYFYEEILFQGEWQTNCHEGESTALVYKFGIYGGDGKWSVETSEDGVREADCREEKPSPSEFDTEWGEGCSLWREHFHDLYWYDTMTEETVEAIKKILPKIASYIEFKNYQKRNRNITN